MRKIGYIFILLSFNTVEASRDTRELDLIYSLLKDYPDSAFVLSTSMRDQSEKDRDYFGLVKSNYLLGYLEKQRGDVGKSVIYYLEAIRYSANASYERVVKDQISLRKNLANIFRQYDANKLATVYNLEAIDIATKHHFTKQVTQIKFHQALVYENSEQFDEAIQSMLDIIPTIEDADYKNRVINQLGLIYLQNKEYSKAEQHFTQLLHLPDEFKIHSAKAYHNLGEVHYETGYTDKAIEDLMIAIEIKESMEDIDEYTHTLSLFLSYRNIGRYLFEVGEIPKSQKYLHKAEELVESVAWDAKDYDVYNVLSALYYSINNDDLGKKYNEIYSSKLHEHLKIQNDLRKKEKEMTFDLITKRYMDKVERQSSMASILFYSKLISISLLTILIFIVIFHWYKKNKLRRDIEKDLKELDMF